jgi:hypothetical protein
MPGIVGSKSRRICYTAFTPITASISRSTHPSVSALKNAALYLQGFAALSASAVVTLSGASRASSLGAIRRPCLRILHRSRQTDPVYSRTQLITGARSMNHGLRHRHFSNVSGTIGYRTQPLRSTVLFNALGFARCREFVAKVDHADTGTRRCRIWSTVTAATMMAPRMMSWTGLRISS